MSNTSDKLTGKAKILAGRVTGNKRLEVKGKIQYGMAQFREKAEDIMRLLSEAK